MYSTGCLYVWGKEGGVVAGTLRHCYVQEYPQDYRNPHGTGLQSEDSPVAGRVSRVMKAEIADLEIFSQTNEELAMSTSGRSRVY